MPFPFSFETGFYQSKSVLTVKKLVDWKKKNGFYNFKQIPKTVILSPTNSVKKRELFFKKKIKGLTGKAYIINNILYVTNFGVGAPSVIVLLEELVALGVEKFIFIGLCGRLNNLINESDAFLCKEAFSLNGSSYFYTNENMILYESEISKKISKKLNLAEKRIVSVDVPFRETVDLIDIYKKKGAELIDMETASVLAFSKVKNIDACCVLIASDYIENDWFPPKKIKNTYRKLNFITKKIISIL